MIMDMSEADRIRRSALRGQLRRREPMSRHTSWRTGGVADRAYRPADLADLAMFLRGVGDDEPLCFVGLGSNLLVRDGGLRGTVVLLHAALQQLHVVTAEDGRFYAEAGVASPKLSRFAATRNFEGAEFLAGIPGTIGGALAMNAGCFGATTWERVEQVLTISRKGELRQRAASEYRVGYREVQLRQTSQHSSTVDPDAEFFAAGWFRFARGDAETSRTKVRQLLLTRLGTQPLSQPNAGSVFRNPRGRYAAQLIESCGLKGARIGGAAISEKHANFIVNTGSASAADIESLIEKAHDAVLRLHGIALEIEVRIMGDR